MTVMTVFRSRLRDDAGDRYHDTATRMLELARGMPGFVAFEQFVAGDGERVSLVTFATLDEQRAWRDHPEHRAAQRMGRRDFYASYSVAVCEVLEEHTFGT